VWVIKRLWFDEIFASAVAVQPSKQRTKNIKILGQLCTLSFGTLHRAKLIESKFSLVAACFPGVFPLVARQIPHSGYQHRQRPLRYLIFACRPDLRHSQAFPLARLLSGTKFPLKLFSISGFAVRILALGFDSCEPVSAFRSSVVRSVVSLFHPLAISTRYDLHFLWSAVVTVLFYSILTLSFPPARLNLRSSFCCLRP
jgi:hypothetical protein